MRCQMVKENSSAARRSLCASVGRTGHPGCGTTDSFGAVRQASAGVLGDNIDGYGRVEPASCKIKLGQGGVEHGAFDCGALRNICAAKKRGMDEVAARKRGLRTVPFECGELKPASKKRMGRTKEKRRTCTHPCPLVRSPLLLQSPKSRSVDKECCLSLALNARPRRLPFPWELGRQPSI